MKFKKSRFTLLAMILILLNTTSVASKCVVYDESFKEILSKASEQDLKKGKYEEYFSEDQPKFILGIKKSSLDGYSKVFYKDGSIREEAQFSKGVLNGSLNRFDKKQQLREKLNFKQGKLNGLCKTYDKKGTLILEANYLNDNLHGVVKRYSKKGSIVEVLNYKNDVKEGLHQVYHSNGKLKLEETYKNDSLQGIAKSFDEVGNLTVSKEYDAGHLKAINKPVKPKKERRWLKALGKGVLIMAAVTAIAATAASAAQASSGSYYQPRTYSCNQPLKGCCSWHGGINSIVGTWVLCNDGMYSPTCRCY